MGKNKYFLFARDKDNNKITLISLSNNDISGKGDDFKAPSNSLANIDRMTLRFKNQEDLILNLVNDGRINNYNSDIFIAVKNGEDISYLENIYCDYSLSYKLRNFLNNVSDSSFVSSSNDVLDVFAYMMFNDGLFKRFIESKYHNVYSKYVDYFKDCYGIDDAYEVKSRESSWAEKSYSLIRNIVEAISRYYTINKDGNIVKSAAEYQELLLYPRDRCMGDLAVYTDNGYYSGQINLFIEENDVDKLEYVINYIDQIDCDTLVLNDDNVEFNKNLIECSDLEYQQLNNIDNKLVNYLYLYLVSKKFNKNEDNSDEFTSISNKVKENIYKMLETDEKELNKTYAFCLLHKKIINRQEKTKVYKKQKEI